MKFFRITVSSNLKEVGVFPQRREMNVGINIDAPNHLLKQPPFKILDPDIYIPSFNLHPKAKLTDIISLPINSDWIISLKLKEILESQKIDNIQILPITIYKNDNCYEYYILHSIFPQMDCIAYSDTDILIKEVLSEYEEKITVQSFDDFQLIESKIAYPKYLEFKKFQIRSDCNCNFFTLKYTYGLTTYFISEYLKTTLEQNNITGIRYMELDEVL